MPTTPSWLTIVLALIAGGGAWITARVTARSWKPGQREQGIIALQETRLEALESRMDALTARQILTERRLGLSNEYGWALRADALKRGVPLEEIRPWPEGVYDEIETENYSK